MPLFLQDLREQPQGIRDVAQAYSTQTNASPLHIIGRAVRPLLTGMGASFHAGLVAATHLHALGVPAVALESSELLYYSSTLLDNADALVFVSQSGSSAEVIPLTAQLAESVTLVGVTNHSESPLAQRAAHVLPLHATLETVPVASKTYLNTLAVLWLLARLWGGATDGSEREQLLAVADRCDALLAQADALAGQWLDTLGDVQTLLFVGHGPHAATARHAAMMVEEWVKQPAIGLSIGAFRHGPIEITRPGLGVVVFAGAGRSRASAQALAEEIQGYGARVVLVEAGRSGAPSTLSEAGDPVDEFLMPILDVIPAQLFVQALARHRGADTTFRHISKVVTRL